MDVIGKRTLTILLSVVLGMSVLPIRTAAMSGNTEGTGEVVLPTNSENVVSVVLPTVSTESPFDFLIDPENLIYKTGASKYGGGIVEENANLLFHNRQTEGIDFSRSSDLLSVTNKSSVPVDVTISARIMNLGEIILSEEPDIADSEETMIYLALIDGDGNNNVLSEEVINSNITLDRAPSGVYTWIYEETSDSYKYVIGDDHYVVYDSYTFGLTGECSKSEKWKDINVRPQVEITWEIEPVLGNDEKPEEDEEQKKDSSDTEDISIDETNTDEVKTNEADVAVVEMEYAGDTEDAAEITVEDDTQQ